MILKRVFALFLCVSISHYCSAQFPGKKIIQFSGVLYSSDSPHFEIPFATVFDASTGIGSISSYNGFFTVVAYEGDTIIFSSIGFKPKFFIVPTENELQKMSTNVFLDPTYYMLSDAVIYPWGSKDKFPYAFIHTPVPDDDLARARKNLDPDYLRSLAAARTADPQLNTMMVLNNYSQSMYYYGQSQPISLMNPLAWAQFFSDLKKGKYKNPNK